MSGAAAATTERAMYGGHPFHWDGANITADARPRTPCRRSGVGERKSDALTAGPNAILHTQRRSGWWYRNGWGRADIGPRCACRHRTGRKLRSEVRLGRRAGGFLTGPFPRLAHENGATMG